LEEKAAVEDMSSGMIGDIGIWVREVRGVVGRSLTPSTSGQLSKMEVMKRLSHTRTRIDVLDRNVTVAWKAVGNRITNARHQHVRNSRRA
jgi:hypothetical protein